MAWVWRHFEIVALRHCLRFPMLPMLHVSCAQACEMYSTVRARETYKY